MIACNECVNYKKESCVFLYEEYKRQDLIKNHKCDCWQSETDKLLCDMMCGGIEEDE